MRTRVTFSLDESTIAFLNRGAAVRTGGNVSAYVDELVHAAALAESVRAEAAWHANHATYADDAEAERDAA